MSIDVVGVVIAAILFVAWLARLESKTGMNSRDIVEMKERTVPKLEERIGIAEDKTENLDTRVMDKLSRIETILTERLAKIEGKLSMKE